jgi:hypothetical protein
MPWQENPSPPRTGRAHGLRANAGAVFVLVLIAIAAWSVTQAQAAPESTRLIRTVGKIVPIPASIPHEEGDMVDSRILPDLRWIAAHYPIYVTDGYSGPLPNGEHAGCNRCHTRNSDHYNGLAVDLVPLGATSRCDRLWQPITRLARWAEPRQNQPAPPFRWVGYDGDAGHGCGNHLHLSWNHAPAREYALAEWVEVLGSHPTIAAPKPGTPVQHHIKRPTGGLHKVETGGLEARRID